MKVSRLLLLLASVVILGVAIHGCSDKGAGASGDTIQAEIVGSLS